MAEKKFCDMGPDERFDDLQERVNRFNMLALPGQIRAYPLGALLLLHCLCVQKESCMNNIIEDLSLATGRLLPGRGL